MTRRLYFIFALGIVFLIAALASAQEGDPQPAQVIPTITPTSTSLPPTATPTARATLEVTLDPLLVAPQVEIAFPAGIRFFIRAMASADEVTSARLTLGRQEHPPQTFELDLATTAADTGDYTDITYIWALTPEIYPSFFEEIDFVWTVTIRDEISTARVRFAFTDERVIWETAEVESLRVTMPRDLGLRRLMSMIAPVEKLMRDNTGSQHSLSFILYEQTLDPSGCVVNADDVPFAFTLSGVALRCLDRNLAQRIFTQSELEVLRVRSYTQVDMQNTLTQALFARYYSSLWSEQNVPEWFEFGLMRIFAPTEHSDMLSIAQNAARSSSLLSLPEMARIPDDPALLQNWQAQSLAMTLYMADRIGYPRLLAFARTLPQSAFEPLYRETASQPLSALIPAMRDWLFTERGLSAFNVSIYAEPTNTSVPRATFTPFPATRTPRPEPSATMTPTITNTPSPRPTLTATASVTPRPPGSLATATPIPTPIPTSVADSTAQMSIVAIIGIVIAGLIVLFARVGRR